MTVIRAAAAPASTERASLEAYEAAMEALAEGLDDGPALAPAALTREVVYGHN